MTTIIAICDQLPVIVIIKEVLSNDSNDKTMSLRKFRNSTFKLIKDGFNNYIDRDHFMGHSSMEGDHQQVDKGELKHSSNPIFKKK